MSVTIYTTPTCPYCHAAMEYFDEHSVAYEQKDVMEDEAAREDMITLTGQLGVPVIAITKDGQEDPEVVLGFNEGKLAELLEIQD